MDDTNKLSEERYCLGCRKLGHRTDECHSTHGLNTPEAREMGRLAHIAWNARQATPPVALPAVVDAEAVASKPGRICLDEAVLVSLFTVTLLGAYRSVRIPNPDPDGAEELVLEVLAQVKRFS